MATDHLYTVTYSDTNTGKSPFTIRYGEFNNENTSLTLYGYGAKDYGLGLTENFVKLLENFCSYQDPLHATEGQLWYNPRNKQLSLYVKKTKPDGSANGYKWTAITPVIGFDGNIQAVDPNDAAANVTNAVFTNTLKDYLHKSGRFNDSAGNSQPFTMTGNLILLDDSTWYNQDGSISTTNTDPNLGLYAAPKKYVDLKVKTEIDNQLKLVDLSQTQSAILAALKNMTELPFIFNDNKDPSKRTMKKGNELFLRDQSDLKSVSDNEAVSKSYVVAAISSANSNPLDKLSSTQKTLDALIELAKGDTAPFIKKSGDKMNTDAVLQLRDQKGKTLVANEAITHEYLEERLAGAIAPPTVSGTGLSSVSYTKMEDGTLMVYGTVRNFDYGSYDNDITEIMTCEPVSWANISGCPPFINNDFAVQLTDNNQDFSVAGVLYKSAFWRFRGGCWGGNTKYLGYPNWNGAWYNSRTTSGSKDLSNVWSSAQKAAVSKHAHDATNGNGNGKTMNPSFYVFPIVYQSFAKTTTSFHIGGWSYRKLAWDYVRNMVSCNFTAIGRWK